MPARAQAQKLTSVTTATAHSLTKLKSDELTKSLTHKRTHTHSQRRKLRNSAF